MLNNSNLLNAHYTYSVFVRLIQILVFRNRYKIMVIQDVKVMIFVNNHKW